MPKNHPVLTSRWWAAASIRAVKTVAQVLVTLIGTELVGVHAIDWLGMLSVAAASGVLSLLTSLAGLPEVEAEVDATPPPADYEPRYRAEE